MKTELIAEKGKILSRAFQLGPDQCVCLGRGEDADIQILDAGLSRQHCTLTREGDHFVLRDLGSRNGCWVNGIRIKESTLKAGDKVQLGGLVFEFRVSEDRRRRPANLITSVPEGAPGDVRDKIDLGESGLMSLPPEFQNVENYKRIQRDLSTIYRVGNLIQSETNLQRLYTRVIGAIFDVIAADRCYLLIENRGRNALSVAAARSAAQEGVKDVDSPDSSGFSHTIADKAYEDGVAVMRVDALTDDRFSQADSVIIQDIRSVMCVPLEDQTRCFGVIYVDTVGRSQAFRRHDLELLTAVAKQAGIAIQRVLLMEEVTALLHGTTRALVATIEAKDKYTHGHSERVTEYALHIARALGLPDSKMKFLELAGFMHDIGKIGVAENILNKKEPLTDEEWEVIRQHPVVGADIIVNIERTDTISRAVRHHHERWNGSGYPGGLAGEKISPLGRILAVADAFDAMTSARPYRDSRSSEYAIQELLKGAGEQFDPEIVEVFCREFKEGRIRAALKPPPA